ncbi:MAG: hypothetical protein AABW49_04245 [Nanoarchaeota archaeon]
MNWKHISTTLRVMYCVLLVVLTLKHYWNALLFSVPAFFLTAPLFFQGKKNNSYYKLDAAIMMIFILEMILFFSNYWKQDPKYFGLDKLFHLASGAWTAGLTVVILHNYFNNKKVLALIAVAFSLALAGVWEIFEWVLSILPPPFLILTKGYTDTILDLIAVAIGGCITALVFIFKK